MDTDGEMLTSPALPEGKKPRGRPRLADVETPKQRVDRLQAELREAQAALRLMEEKRAALVGVAVVRHARHNTEFARHLAVALRAEVKSQADQAAIADLLVGDGAAPQSRAG